MAFAPVAELARPVIRACLFDVYGTLLDLNTALREHRQLLGDLGGLVAGTWRTKQLEYAWTASLSGAYRDFWTCTSAALDFALELHGADRRCRDSLLEAYRTIEPFDDTVPALKHLRARGIRTAVLSNGTAAMLEEAFRAAGLLELIDDCVSIDPIGIYKPARRAYTFAAETLGLESTRCGFVSANAWDIAGAHRAGLPALWINRLNLPSEYGIHDVAEQARSLLGTEYFRAPNVQ